MFSNYKEVLEKANYFVRGNEILNPQGQPVAGSDAYGQVWYKDPFVEEVCTKKVELFVHVMIKGITLPMIQIHQKTKHGLLK